MRSGSETVPVSWRTNKYPAGDNRSQPYQYRDDQTAKCYHTQRTANGTEAERDEHEQIQLEQNNCEQHERHGQPMNASINSTGQVGEKQIVSVYEVFQNQIGQT